MRLSLKLSGPWPKKVAAAFLILIVPPLLVVSVLYGSYRLAFVKKDLPKITNVWHELPSELRDVSTEKRNLIIKVVEPNYPDNSVLNCYLIILRRGAGRDHYSYCPEISKRVAAGLIVDLKGGRRSLNWHFTNLMWMHLLTHYLSPEQLLSLYCSYSSFKDGRGLDNAAISIFSKRLADLTDEQMIYLLAISDSPADEDRIQKRFAVLKARYLE